MIFAEFPCCHHEVVAIDACDEQGCNAYGAQGKPRDAFCSPGHSVKQLEVSRWQELSGLKLLGHRKTHCMRMLEGNGKRKD